jgi:anhydro-N-acetylmuramic acid kinase
MNSGILRLSEIAKKESRLIIGLMSGTSLDGLDIALVNISNYGKDTSIALLAFETVSYTEEVKNKIKSISFVNHVDLEQVCLLNKSLGQLYGSWINDFLKKHHFCADEIDLIASHGQTIYHSPARLRTLDHIGNATLQIADADQIAVNTGIITLSDFRQKNIAQGEEGAPLALYGDYLLFKNSVENRILLNIGGISNFSILPLNAIFESVISSDIGPGNTIMDQFIQANFANKFYDNDALIASAGNYHQGLLTSLLDHPFFDQAFPKSTGPELFNLTYLKNAIEKAKLTALSVEDIMATLNRFTAHCIAEGVKIYYTPKDYPVMYLSGGGVHNPLLISNLKEIIPFVQIKNTSDLGINPDAKEAILFALLANETIAGNYSLFSKKTLSMGKISLPN